MLEFLFKKANVILCRHEYCYVLSLATEKFSFMVLTLEGSSSLHLSSKSPRMKFVGMFSWTFMQIPAIKVLNWNSSCSFVPFHVFRFFNTYCFWKGIWSTIRYLKDIYNSKPLQSLLQKTKWGFYWRMCNKILRNMVIF